MEGHPLNNLFLELMRWVYDLTAGFSPEGFGSVVLTIVLCTTILRALTIFSDIKTRKSSMEMAAIQPELQKIQKKYQGRPAPRAGGAEQVHEGARRKHVGQLPAHAHHDAAVLLLLRGVPLLGG